MSRSRTSHTGRRRKHESRLQPWAAVIGILAMLVVLVGLSNWLLSEKVLRPLVTDEFDGHLAGAAVALLPPGSLIGVILISRRRSQRGTSRWAIVMSIIAVWSMLVGIASVGGRHASRSQEQRIDRVLPGYREGYFVTLASWFSVLAITGLYLKKSGRVPSKGRKSAPRRTSVGR